MSDSEVPERPSPVEGIIRWFNEPKDIASMVFIRVVFGIIMLYEALHYFHKGWIARYFIDPEFHFKYPYFGWAQPLPGVGMYIVFGLMALFAFFIAIGFFYRISAAAFAVLFIYMFTIDAARYLNHFYLISLLSLIMIVVPAHRSFSVDARLRPSLQSDTIPAWALYLIRFQIFIVYFFGGVHKLNPDWLHGEPMRSMLYDTAFRFPFVGESFFNEPVVFFFVMGGMLLDLFVVPAMLWKPTRIPAYLVALSFHLSNSQIFTIGIFPWFMICATALFFDPDWPRRLLRRPEIKIPDVSDKPISGKQKLITAGVVLYMAIQFIIPWRPYLHGGHLLDQGDVTWFSWNMMLVRPMVDLKFRLVDNDTGEEWEVDPTTDLHALQRLVALPKPGNVHQLAIEHARRAREDGHENVSVYADFLVALNSRPFQRRIDPTVDLAATPQTLGVKPWVVSLESDHPPDPEDRRRFTLARWRFMNEKGYLPFDKDKTDPKVYDELKEFEVKYYEERGIEIVDSPMSLIE